MVEGIKHAWKAGQILRQPSDDYVFISYFSEDFNKVSELKSELERVGYSVWLDNDQLKPGDPLNREITDAIYKSSAFILCYSEETDKRSQSWVYQELETAKDIRGRRTPRNTFIIPVRLSKDCALLDWSFYANSPNEELKSFDYFGKGCDIKTLVGALDKAYTQSKS